MRKSGGITIGIGSSSCRWRFLRCWRGQYKNEGRQHMRKITVLDFANQIGVLSDEVPVVVKTDRKVIGRFRCLYEIPETAMPGVLEAKIDHVILRSDEITIQVKLKAVTTATREIWTSEMRLCSFAHSARILARTSAKYRTAPALRQCSGRMRTASANATPLKSRGKSNERPQNIRDSYATALTHLAH